MTQNSNGNDGGGSSPHPNYGPGRPPKPEPTYRMTVSFPESTYFRFMTYVTDPATDKQFVGARSQILTMLLDELFKAMGSGEDMVNVRHVKEFVQRLGTMGR